MVYEISQILLEDLGFACREFERLRLVRILEIVYVAPVWRSGLGFGDFFKVTSSCRSFAGDWGPRCEDVESFRFHLYSECEGLEGSILADDSFERRKFFAGLTLDLSRRTFKSQFFRRKFTSRQFGIPKAH